MVAALFLSGTKVDNESMNKRMNKRMSMWARASCQTDLWYGGEERKDGPMALPSRLSDCQTNLGPLHTHHP
jgi:hypothetical protein